MLMIRRFLQVILAQMIAFNQVMIVMNCLLEEWGQAAIVTTSKEC